jgi:hypothetical protein
VWFDNKDDLGFSLASPATAEESSGGVSWRRESGRFGDRGSPPGRSPDGGGGGGDDTTAGTGGALGGAPGGPSGGPSSGRRVKREKKSDMGGELLEGYVLSAGLDQRVLLWDLYGKLVGEFGSYGWDIKNAATWFKGPNLLSELASVKKNGVHKGKSVYNGVDSGPKYRAQDTSASSVTKETVGLIRSPSTTMMQNIGKHKHHTSKQLNDYVEALTRKIATKPAVYLDVDAHYNNIMVGKFVVSFIFICLVPLVIFFSTL